VVEVQRTTREQWQALKQLRLQALEDAPTAFGSTLAREHALDDSEWQRRADGDSWLALVGGRAVGMVAVVPDDVSEHACQLVGMWVAPDFRGTGVAAALLEVACARARERGAEQVALWVADGNDRARRAYEQYGFTATGERQPLPSDPSRGEDRMSLQLDLG
jgi:ribosomal protein S18 acetylase RimI-like enzyme